MMLNVYCKGLCEPNPDGTMAWGFVAVDGATGEILERQLGSVAPPSVKGERRATNYVSEYGAILRALDWLHTLPACPPTTIHASLTSALNRIQGSWPPGDDTVTERMLGKVIARAAGLPLCWAHVKTEINPAVLYANAAYQQATGRAPTDWAAVNARRAAASAPGGPGGGR